MRPYCNVLGVSIPGLLAIGAFATGGCATGASTRADKEAVLSKVQDFFDAMEHRDVELAERTLIPEAGYVSVRPGEAGRIVRHSTNAQFVEQLAGRKDEYREWLDGPTVMVEGDVAMVWSPYYFERNGEMSHTGVDVFCFVRTDAGWMMAGGAYSVVLVKKD